MNIFAIADLHLSFTTDKAMSVFGEAWFEHWKKIKANWLELISPEDIVLVPGDISWAMHLSEAKEDLDWLSQLPGIKVLIKGNHDYWWESLKKQKAQFPQLNFLQNNSIIFEDTAICGSRGWNIPTGPEATDEDKRIYTRELLRLQMSIDSIGKNAKKRIVMMHYPPLYTPKQDSDFTRILEENSIDICVYGHLHGLSRSVNYNYEKNGVKYYLASADYLNFTPIKLEFT